MPKGLSRWDWPDGVEETCTPNRAKVLPLVRAERATQAAAVEPLSLVAWWVVEQSGDRPDIENKKTEEKAAEEKVKEERAGEEKRGDEMPETNGTQLPNAHLEDFCEDWVPIAELHEALL